MVRARVHAFHVDAWQLPAIADAIDAAASRLVDHPDFRGLLFLERGERRHEIVAVTLWADTGLEDTELDAERSRKQIAASADAGVSTRAYNVLRSASALDVAHPLLASRLVS